MANTLVEAYRRALAAKGLFDDTPDYFLTQELGQAAERQNRAVFDIAPDFAEEYAQIREANAPSLPAEAWNAAKRATRGLGATALGGAALVTDSGKLREWAQALDKPAEGDEGATIATMEDIGPGRSTLGKVFSRDALRYGVGQIGGAVPSIAEAVGTSAVGGLLGSAVAPGPGTVAGAGVGLVERGLIKGAIRQLLKKGAQEGAESVAETLVKRGVIKEATEDALQSALLAGSEDVAGLVARQAKTLATRRSAAAVNTLNSYLLNAGEIYNDNGDRGISSALGVVAAIPDTILPQMVLKRLFPNVGTDVAKQSAKNYIGKLALEVVKDTGIEGSTEGFQEAVKVVARNLKEGRSPTEFTEDDWRQIREAAVGGVAGGLVAAPGTAMNLSNELGETRKDEKRRAALAARENAARIASETSILTPPAPQPQDVARGVSLMTPEERAARLQELRALPELSPLQQTEVNLLSSALEAEPPAAPPANADWWKRTLSDQEAADYQALKDRLEEEQTVAAQQASRQPPVPAVDEAQRTAQFNQRVLELTSQLTNEGVPVAVARDAARALAGASSPEEFNFIRQQVNRRYPPARAARERAATFKSFEELPSPAPVAAPEATPQAPAPTPAPAPVVQETPAAPTPTPPVSETPVAQAPAPIAATPPVQPTPAPVAVAPISQAAPQVAALSAAPAPTISQPVAEVTPPPAPPPPAVADITPAAPLPQPPATTSFKFGPVIEGSSSIDFRTEPRLANLTSEQLMKGLPEIVRGIFSTEGSRSKTRSALVLQAPDGHVVQAGITVPQKITDTGGRKHYGTASARIYALQGMAENTREGGRVRKSLREGGAEPAMLSEVLAAGYKPIAYVSFDAQPGRIFQSFASPEEFDAAWAGSKKSTGKQGSMAMGSGRGVQAAIEQSTTQNQLAQIERRIDEIGRLLQKTSRGDPQFDALVDEYRDLAERQSDLFSRAQNLTGTDELPAHRLGERAAAPMRVEQFKAAISRLTQLGIRVDLFSRELYRQIDPETDAAAVTWTPYHISMAIDDVLSANLDHLASLIHEAVHATHAQLPAALQARVSTAAFNAFAQLAHEAQTAAEKNAQPVAKLYDANEALAESIAQRLAAEGIPEAPSIAQAIVRWVSDLYQRVAMAIQAGLGLQPSDGQVLSWFENQMRRRLGGDFDYRLINFMERFLPEPMVVTVGRHEVTGGTPGGVTDFVDPLTLQMSQPTVSNHTLDGLEFNARHRVVPVEEGMNYDEAQQRINGASLREEIEVMEGVAKELNLGPLTPELWKLVGRGDHPAARMAKIAELQPGAEQARIGDERATRAMNEQARLEALVRIRKIQLAQARKAAMLESASQKASSELLRIADEKAVLEANVRDAELHERTMQGKLRDMVRSLARGTRRGLALTAQQTSLAEAIREAGQIGEFDAIPQDFQAFLDRVLVGSARAGFEGQDTVPISLFRYLEAVASLDLDLGKMGMRDILQKIEEQTDNPALVDLARNRPLMAAVAALARDNADQMDQIQLGRVRDTVKYLKIQQELDQIRTANEVQLRSLMGKVSDLTKQRGLVDRLKARYIQRRAEVRRAQAVVAKAAEQGRILREFQGALAPHITRLETDVGNFSDWHPAPGAKWTAMQLTPEGDWRPVERTLAFYDDGSLVDADQASHDLVQNTRWLAQNRDKAGSEAYQRIERQTKELRMLDFQQVYPAQHRGLMDRILQPLGEEAEAAGHSSGARIKQMLNQWQFILKSYWRGDIELASKWWMHATQNAEKASGITDHDTFFRQVYDPVMYALANEPGLDEAQAIRHGIRVARANLTREPAANFNEAMADLIRRTKTINDHFVAINERYGNYVSDPRLGGQLRKGVNQGWLTVMRRMRNDVVATLTADMEKAGWKLELKKEEGGEQQVVRATTFDELPAAVAADPQALSQTLSPLFTPGIIDRWLQPFLNKPGAPLFKVDGDPVSQLDVQQAWQDSGGDVVKWIDGLAARLGKVTAETRPEELADFRLSILRQLDGLFGMEARMAYEAKHTRNLFDPQGPRPHVIMDARINELIPPEHLQHQVFDAQSARVLLGLTGFHAAFGRNGERMVRTLQELKDVLHLRKQQFEQLTGSSRNARMADAIAQNLDYKQLERAARSYDDVIGLQSKLEHLFSPNNSMGPQGEVRGGLEYLGFITGQVVNNPKTGLLNLVSLAERPLTQRSLGPDTIRGSIDAYRFFTHNVLGSFLESLNLHVLNASEVAKEIGEVEGRGFGRLPWTVALSEIGKEGNLQATWQDRWMIRPLRAVANFQRKGPALPGRSEDFARFNVTPGIGSVINFLSQESAVANAQANVSQFELTVKRGMRFFASHPEKLDDPTFRFTAKDLGMQGRGFFGNEGVFEYWRKKAVEYRVGNLEDIVRDAMTRQENGERLLTREQVLAISMMSANELNLESSINTRPGFLTTNPLLKWGMPLIGWPMAKMNQVNQAMKTIDGQRSIAQALRTVATMAMWTLPVGLAFTLWMDQYDEKWLKKKSNLTGIDWQAAIPFVGPAWALAGGEKSVRQNLVGMVERQAKAGNIYGLGADLAAQIFTPLVDPQSGQRAFSLDQRVLVMSQFLTVQQAITNWINQGEATYASVYKPLFQALGGNGVLHGVDLMDSALGLDNQEARMVQRTNVGNWLRSAGREVGLELRKAGAGGSPTAVSAWVREMQLASFANDRVEFMQAYQRALQAAREEGAPDPEKKVLESWMSREPLDVFRGKVTEYDKARLLSVMDPEGRRAVTDAIRLFEEYTKAIAPTQMERYLTRQRSRLRPQSAESLRRSAANLFSP